MASVFSRGSTLPGAPRPQVQSPHGLRPSLVCRAWPEWMRGLMDFNSWAPKSTRIWRLNEYEYPESKPDEIDELQAKINRLSQEPQAVSPQSPLAGMPPLQNTDDGQLPAMGSFAEAGDSDLAKALSSRIQTLSSSSESDDGDFEEEPEPETDEVFEVVPEITGQELRDLILTKYGKTYDCSFARRDIPGKTFVCLNIMWQHLEQRSFRLTEEQYEEKIGSIAYMLNVLGQTKKVRAFLKAPAKSHKGLPRRPVVGTAISIQLELPPEVIKEFFSAGYQ